MKGQLRPLFAAVNAALVAMATNNVHAADAKPAAPAIEEVVITAQKAEQSQQVVPVSVVALSADALQRAAVLNVRDLQTTVPGLFIATNNQGGAPTFAIRAAKADNGTSDTVTAYVDDMPVVTTRAVANMTYDMASITTLKGPQGTLFGANSTGGAIIFRPNKPTDVFEGYAEIGVGNYGRQQFQGMVNVPVNDVLQLRLAGETVRRDGFIKNHTPANGNSELQDDKHDSLRLSVRIKPNSALTNDLVLGYFHEDDQSFGDIAVAFRGRYSVFGLPVDYAKAGLVATGDTRNVSASAVPTWVKAKITDAINTTNYEISDAAAFKNVIGYQKAELDTSQNYAELPYPYAPNTGRNTFNYEQWTWEPSLDLKSTDGRLRNKTGLFFSYRKLDKTTAAVVYGLPFDTTGPLTPVQLATLPRFPIGSNSAYRREFRSHAIYTQFEYDLSKELTAKLGMRYSWDTGKYTASNRSTGGAAALANYGNPYLGTCAAAALSLYEDFDPVACTAHKSLKSQAPSFTFTLEDHFAERSMIYATLRGSYIVGGFNDQANPAVTGMPFVFKPEKVVDFETGLKSDWELWGRPMRTNAAVFYGNYKDQQRVQTGVTAAGVSFVGVMNAGASNYYGLELEATFQPTDNLELSANWSHIESEYTKFNGILNVPGKFAYVDLSGQPMSQTPKDAVSLSATATWPLSSEMGRIKSTLSWFWRDKTVARDAPTVNGTTDASGLLISIDPTQDFRAYDQLPAFDLINFTTDWKSVMGSRFDANFWVKNLTDKKYKIYGSNQMLGFGYASYSFGQPRTIGLNVRYNF